MLSRAEREFLRGEREVTRNYKYVLYHRILRKLREFEETIPALAMDSRTRPWLRSLSASLENLTAKSIVKPLRGGGRRSESGPAHSALY